MRKNLSAAAKSVSLALVSGAAILTVILPAVTQVSTTVTAADGPVVVTPDDRGGW
ncbi:hypothetical protein ACFV0T_36095 [Streptomyces sp. NPDC059582]|uniref:hypothetical protein n=1 Tax=Streptomyces sp. NPDC059582 TaxID=3346875 RepID=UPI0036B6A264